jgi:hypothetical protein
MGYLDIPALLAAPYHEGPYSYVVVPRFVRPEALAAVNADFPVIRRPGSFPLNSLSFGHGFARLIEELTGSDFRRAIERKLGTTLDHKPELITVRGQCRARDGQIHTDTDCKIVSVLIYLNRSWASDGGRIRVLRSSNSLDDFAEEIAPAEGAMLAFRRSECSWHGHKPFAGERRVLQINWITDQKSYERELRRHSRSALFKQLNPLAWLPSASGAR